MSHHQRNRHHDHRLYAAIASTVLAAGVVYELYRLFVAPWPNVTPAHSQVISTGLVLTWSASAAIISLRRRSKVLATAAWALSFTAPLTMLVHTLMTRVMAHSLAGLPYALGTAILVFSLKRTWDGGELPWPWRRLERFPAPPSGAR